MVRVVIDLTVHTGASGDAENIEPLVGDLVHKLRAHWPVSVARADVTASPDPDQATADMLDGYHGDAETLRDIGA